jgi:hypothetical protein
MNWEQRVKEIQNLYFRSGPYTHLWIEYKQITHQLAWCFTFLDLGLCNSVSSHALVTCSEEGEYQVNGKKCDSEKQALDCVFANHYTRYIWEFYREMGLEQNFDEVF